MVTADLPAFARSGSRIDVAVSALGDATNLTGGTLLVTPLLAADGEVYAVAQGALATGAIAARGAATSVTRGVPTSARIANGATVEREVAFQLDKTNALRLGLRNPDLTTARRIAAAINPALGPGRHGHRPAHRRARPRRPRPDRGAGGARGPARRAGQPRHRGDRGGQRHHRHGRQRADQHGGDRPGQPDDPGDRDARGQPAGAVLQRHHAPSCRAPRSRWTTSTTASSASCRAA